jgi:hypothetical protein
MNSEEVINHLEELRLTGDLSAIEKAMAAIEASLRAAKPYERAKLVIYLCDLLTATDLGDYERQDALRHRYASRVLGDLPQLAPEFELPLLAHLEDESGDTSEPTRAEQFRKQRAARARRWLGALRGLAAAMQPSFDFSDLPQVNIAPPGGHGRAGIAPAAVRSVAARQKYEAELKVNRKKAAALVEELRLRRLFDFFAPRAERYVHRVYAQDPADPAEGQRLIAEYLPHGLHPRTPTMPPVLRRGAVRGEEAVRVKEAGPGKEAKQGKDSISTKAPRHTAPGPKRQK